MATPRSGHAVGRAHAHAEPWAWHPVVSVRFQCAIQSINAKRSFGSAALQACKDFLERGLERFPIRFRANTSDVNAFVFS
jgi:hypothetical protein